MKSRIAEIQVTGLQETFDYSFTVPNKGDIVILIAPNGHGKTALLSLLNTCLQFRLSEAVRLSFRTLTITFEDKTRWCFEKTREKRESYNERRRIIARREHGPRDWIKVTFYDEEGRERSDQQVGGAEAIPADIIAPALERALPIVMHELDLFQDLQSGEMLNLLGVVDKYKKQLISDQIFRDTLGPYYQMFLSPSEEHVNSVFIETQRLLYAKKLRRRDSGETQVQEEEVTRQSHYLATVLRDTYASYAAISQALDRSFPSRLITRASISGQKDVHRLRSELDDIELRRRDLTRAGILVETSEPLVAPKDEFLGNVADALAIYVEDSRAKLSTFDTLYPKVSVFRDLMNKKLKPKELAINQGGAVVRRERTDIQLEGLSSGEKHEFIMMFRLVFETPPGSLVLIDEPEISLHVLWQLEFMSDLRAIQGANPFQAVIATHSPQIFQGVEDLIVDLADQAQ